METPTEAVNIGFRRVAARGMRHAHCISTLHQEVRATICAGSYTKGQGIFVSSLLPTCEIIAAAP
jgi:hypothetical protein